MRKSLLILFLIPCYLFLYSQDIPPETEQQLENLTDVDQAETEDDTYLQQLAYYQKHPLNLNVADANELNELRILTDLQIQNFLSYRRLFGKIIDIYELQAIPGWDIITIRKILPFVTVASGVAVKDDLFSRFNGGDQVFLLRISQVLEKSAGFDHSKPGTKYLGSPQRLFFRYRYTYKNLLQFGIVGDKDAGEQFFKGSQKYGFDFYSFHLFIRKTGIIQTFALGDFTVNMGQGLIQWQSLAFKKSVDITAIKRQAAILRPYNSAAEYNFHRGAGITLKKKKIEATVFASVRKLSANFIIDTINFEDHFSSFQTSGYHRTESEIDDRNKLTQTAFGGNIKYAGNRFQVGFNTIYYKFSAPLQKQNEPYNRFAISGDNWYNTSVDYSYTFRNIHVFGEGAIDKNFNKALLNGLLLSVDPKVDVSLVYRNIAKNYQAINANAFTESTYPANEKGLYAGITIRPVNAWRFDAYADIYQFPWLKYLIDAPSSGRDFFIQLTYMPRRNVEIYTRYRNESKQIDQPDNTTVTNQLIFLPKQNWRTQLNYKLTTAITLRSRFDILWYGNKTKNKEKGFLTYFDFVYRPILKPYSAVLRLQYFETDGYNSRLYAYENDVLYSYSIPVFYDKGYRYYIMLAYDLTNKFSLWLRIAQTTYNEKNRIDSGLDEIEGKSKTEVKIQARYLF